MAERLRPQGNLVTVGDITPRLSSTLPRFPRRDMVVDFCSR